MFPPEGRGPESCFHSDAGHRRLFRAEASTGIKDAGDHVRCVPDFGLIADAEPSVPGDLAVFADAALSEQRAHGGPPGGYQYPHGVPYQ